MNLTGYRTFIVMLVGGTLTPWLANKGLNLTADQQTWLVGGVMATLGIVARLFTRTPPASDQPAPPSIQTRVPAVLLALFLVGVLLNLGVLSGCAALGYTAPQTFDQKLAYAYGACDGALKAIPTALTAGTLTSTKAAAVNTMVLQMKTLLDAARASEATDLPTAQKDLTLAAAVLSSVQQYFAANGVS